MEVTAYASLRLSLSKNPKRISLHHRTCKNKTSAPFSPALFHYINKTAGCTCFHSPGRMSSGCFACRRDSVRLSATPTMHPNKSIDSVSFIKDPYSEVPRAKITHSLRSLHEHTQRHTNRMACRFVTALNRISSGCAANFWLITSFHTAHFILSYFNWP